MPGFLRYWSLKRSTILVGFVLTLLGSVGAATYVDPAERAAGGVEAQLRETVATIEILRNAEATYWTFQQQGDLVFALYAMNTKETARDLIGDLVKLALYDRADPIRTVIGQLALANELDYRKTWDAYAAVTDKALADLSFPTFMAVAAFEKGFIEKAEKKVGDLQMARLNLIAGKTVADRRVDQHKLVLLVLTTLGSTFLLAANLIATRAEEDEPPPAEDDSSS